MSTPPDDAGTDDPSNTTQGADERTITGKPDGGPFLLTERNTDEGLLVAVCDADILGDTFENGSVSLTVNEGFYGGDRADEAAIVASLQAAQVANVVGERAVTVAIEAGIVDPGAVLDVGGTRHAQLVRM